MGGLGRHRHRGCGSQFERLWVPPGGSAGPPLVESVAIRFASGAGAEAGLGVARPLAAYVLGLRAASLERRPASVAIGDTTLVFRTGDALVEGRADRPGVVVLWRSGRVLSLLFTGGQAGAGRRAGGARARAGPAGADPGADAARAA